jgi:glycosyltransferase 2 family protein
MDAAATPVRADRRRPALRALAGLALGVAVAVAVASYLGVSGGALLDGLRAARPGPLWVAAAGAMGVLALQSLRWWLVMTPTAAIPYPAALQAMSVGYLFNVLFPARAGDLLRVVYLGKRMGVSRAKLLGTELVDFGSDKLGWVLAFPIVCAFGAPPRWLFRALGAIGGLALLGAAAAVLLASRVGRRRDGGHWGPVWLARLREGVAASGWKRLLAVELLVAPLPWLWETLVVAWASPALGFSLTTMQAFSVLTAFNVASAVPSPGNAGTFEAGGALALTAMGIPHGTSVAFVLLYHLTQVVPTCLLGALVLVVHRERIFGARGLLREPAAERG